MKIKVGDRVKYRREWLQSTGQFTGDIPASRGTVTALKSYGGMAVATVNWGDSESKVAVANLTLASDPERM